MILRGDLIQLPPFSEVLMITERLNGDLFPLIRVTPAGLEKFRADAGTAVWRMYTVEPGYRLRFYPPAKTAVELHIQYVPPVVEC